MTDDPADVEKAARGEAVQGEGDCPTCGHLGDLFAKAVDLGWQNSPEGRWFCPACALGQGKS